VLDTYGNIARKPLDEETSAITNILQDLLDRGEYRDDALLVGLERWVTELHNANERFKSLMLQRYDEALAKTPLVLKPCRTKVDSAYRTILERINALIITEGEPPYAEFVTTLNAVVKRYADILSQQKGKRRVQSAEIKVQSEE